MTALVHVQFTANSEITNNTNLKVYKLVAK